MKTILILLTFIVLALLLIHPVDDTDTWMHIKTGQLIVEQSRMVYTDEYSYTKEGARWVNHQWLSQVIFYLVYKMSGVNGLIFLQAIVIFLAFVLLFKSVYKRGTLLLSVFLIVLVVLFSQERFIIRPLIFSLFLFSVFVFILDRYKYIWDGKKENLIYLLVPLQVLWVNLHGASIMGVFLVWAYIIGEFIDAYIRRDFKSGFAIKGGRYKKLLWTGILVVLLTGITPYGYKAILFPLMESKGMYFIDEWSSTIHGNTLLNFGSMPFYRAFLLISMFVFIFRGRAISSTHIIIFAALLYLSLSSRRHLDLYGFAIAPVVAEHLFSKVTLSNRVGLKIFNLRGWTRVLSVALVVFLILLTKDIITGKYYLNKRQELRVGLGKVGYPDDAIDFLLRAGLRGNMFNDYTSGCYLIWRLYPDKKVFIDGRNTIYGVKFIEENYLDQMRKPELFEKLADRYNISYVFLYHALGSTVRIVPYLYYSEKWKLVFFDDKVCIFARDIKENRDLISKYSVDIYQKKKVVPLKRYKWQDVYPRDYMNRALFYERIGFLEMAIDTLKEVTLIMPEVGDAHYNLGCLSLKKDRHEEAIKEFKAAIKINNIDVDAHNNLGMVYAKLGRFYEALKEFRIALWLEPLHVEARRNLRMAKRDCAQ